MHLYKLINNSRRLLKVRCTIGINSSFDNKIKFSAFSVNSSGFSDLKVNKQSVLPFNKELVIPNFSNQVRFNSQIEHMPSKEFKVPVPWGFIRGQIFGEPSINKIPMLAVHGYLDNSNSFKPLAPLLIGNEYYIISIDLPGQGLSSKLPAGIAYTTKLNLTAIRRVVQYFEMNNFIFLAHSYGCLMPLMYDTVFQGELKAIIGIDMMFGYTPQKWESMATYWKEGIDRFLDTTEFKPLDKTKKTQEPPKKREPLTKELAAKILLKANRHLDEESAKILIERALIENEEGELGFSRDINVKVTMGVRDHYTDFVQLLPDIKKNLSCPVIVIHANPASYGQESLDNTVKFLQNINEESKAQVQIKTMNGTHHFHMIKPKETAAILLKFLDDLKMIPGTKL